MTCGLGRMLTLKLREAQSLAELDRIACHVDLRIDCDSINALSSLRPTSGYSVEEVG